MYTIPEGKDPQPRGENDAFLPTSTLTTAKRKVGAPGTYLHNGDGDDDAWTMVHLQKNILLPTTFFLSFFFKEEQQRCAIYPPGEQAPINEQNGTLP